MCTFYKIVMSLFPNYTTINQQKRGINMSKILSESELSFARLIWEKEPVSSRDLVTLCANQFNWKKSTTYTVLKHLCEYGYFKNENSCVQSLISEDEYLSIESDKIIDERFDGSLSRFLTAFSRKKINEKQYQQIKDIIENFEE